MKNKQRGSLAIAIILILGIAALGFGTYAYINREPLLTYPEPASYVPVKHDAAATTTTTTATTTVSATTSATIKTVIVPPPPPPVRSSLDPNVAFAKCITESGAKFYGAYWCPHCLAQKRAFGEGQAYLPYVECSTPDGQDQTPVCKDLNINQYPTWTFPDGSALTGEQAFAALGAKTKCEIPAE